MARDQFSLLIMRPRLHNYLRTYRKRTGFSQKQIAFLMACESGSKVSRYERRKRTPTLESALALEIIYGVSVGELYAGVRQDIRRDVAIRADRLAVELEQLPPGERTDTQLELLDRLAKAIL